MRTASAIAVSVAVLLLAGAASASDSISKADHYYQLYAETLESARQAAQKGYWDLYNELYQKAQYYRREYEFYRSVTPEAPVVIYRTYPEPVVRYETYTYVSPPVCYVAPAPIYYYTPAPIFGLRLRFGDYDRHSGFDDHRGWNVGRGWDSRGRGWDSHGRGGDSHGRSSGRRHH